MLFVLISAALTHPLRGQAADESSGASILRSGGEPGDPGKDADQDAEESRRIDERFEALEKNLDVQYEEIKLQQESLESRQEATIYGFLNTVGILAGVVAVALAAVSIIYFLVIIGKHGEIMELGRTIQGGIETSRKELAVQGERVDRTQQQLEHVAEAFFSRMLLDLLGALRDGKAIGITEDRALRNKVEETQARLELWQSDVKRVDAAVRTLEAMGTAAAVLDLGRLLERTDLPGSLRDLATRAILNIGRRSGTEAKSSTPPRPGSPG